MSRALLENPNLERLPEQATPESNMEHPSEPGNDGIGSQEQFNAFYNNDPRNSMTSSEFPAPSDAGGVSAVENILPQPENVTIAARTAGEIVTEQIAQLEQVS